MSDSAEGSESDQQKINAGAAPATRKELVTQLKNIVQDYYEWYSQPQAAVKTMLQKERNLVEGLTKVKPAEAIHGLSSTEVKNLQKVCNSLNKDSELSIIDVAIALREFDVLKDLILSRPNQLIPACLTALVQLKPMIASKKANCKKAKSVFDEILGWAGKYLDELFEGTADEDQKNRLFNYINGTFKADSEDTSGPNFLCRLKKSSTKWLTLMEMIEEVGECDLFANECLHQMIEEEWNRDEPFSQRAVIQADAVESASNQSAADESASNQSAADESASNQSAADESATNQSAAVKSANNQSAAAPRCYVSPRSKFYIHLSSFLIFNIFFAWYITDFPRTFKFWPVEFVLVSYFLSFTVQEILDICKRSAMGRIYVNGKKLKCPVYFKDVLNLLDCSALILMWIGLLWKLAIWGCIFDYVTNVESSSMCSETNSTAYQAMFHDVSGNRKRTQPTPYSAYACQMILSTAFLLWGFRSVSFLSYSEQIGPVVSMLKTLIIKDLIPFSVIILIIFYSFGVFFFNLLFPVVTSTEADRNESDYSWHAFLQVFMLPLNLLFTNFDVLPIDTAKGKDQVMGEIAHHLGYKWFSRVLMFTFLLLSNIVMMNLLIARFSLTVSRMDVKSVEIWRKKNAEMLREYQICSPVPAPFSFIHYSYKLFRWCQKQRDKVDNPQTKHAGPIKDTWNEPEKYPKSYREYLNFQDQILPLNSRREIIQTDYRPEAVLDHVKRLVYSGNKEFLQKLDSIGLVQKNPVDFAGCGRVLTGTDPSASCI